MRKFVVEVQILHNDDGLMQGQTLLGTIQSKERRPDGVICHLVGTALNQVAREAAAHGIGWMVLNRDADYVSELRKRYDAPVCAVALDQEEIGKIQGKQFECLLPEGGLVLYIAGPSTNPIVKQRITGMYTTKPENIELRMIRGKLSQQSGYDAVKSWLSLSTSQNSPVKLIAAQNDAMAMGARKAFEEIAETEKRERWCRLPFIGCDACQRAGQVWFRKGLLAASIRLPATAGLAVEFLAKAIRTQAQPQERQILPPVSFPPLQELALVRKTYAKAGS